jgi:hypothetical protein
MAYTNKTYVAFDADSDIRYYRLMQAWKHNDNTSFNFYDAHDLTNIMKWSTEESIKSSLQERLRNTKVFVLLVGEKTRFLNKFVRWEIEQAISRSLPIIAVNLNGNRYMDSILCPPILKPQLALHISFNQKIMERALSEWEGIALNYKKKGITGDFHYSSEVYQRLGI